MSAHPQRQELLEGKAALNQIRALVELFLVSGALAQLGLHLRALLSWANCGPSSFSPYADVLSTVKRLYYHSEPQTLAMWQEEVGWVPSTYPSCCRK